MTPYKVTKIFQTFIKLNPHPKTELHFTTPYECLVAVTLSAQATDIGVNKATSTLFKVANTPEKIYALGTAGLITFIKSIGLYKGKAKNIIAAAEILITKHNSQVPQTRAALEELPGVGRKTANVVLNVVFAQPTMAVDTHIFRVSRRIGLAHGNTPLKVEQELLQIIPKKYLPHAHHWLILHGRYICKARKPECANCPIEQWCEKNL
jgi:endonuclease-3